jgi:hypothetical protein
MKSATAGAEDMDIEFGLGVVFLVEVEGVSSPD